MTSLQSSLLTSHVTDASWIKKKWSIVESPTEIMSYILFSCYCFFNSFFNMGNTHAVALNQFVRITRLAELVAHSDEFYRNRVCLRKGFHNCRAHTACNLTLFP